MIGYLIGEPVGEVGSHNYGQDEKDYWRYDVVPAEGSGIALCSLFGRLLTFGRLPLSENKPGDSSTAYAEQKNYN
jgi:hypothetical protein